MESDPRKISMGTLHWSVLENRITDTRELMNFLSRPEYRHLLDDFYMSVGPEVADRLRDGVPMASELRVLRKALE